MSYSLIHGFRPSEGNPKPVSRKTIRITFDAEFPDTATLQEIEDSVTFDLCRTGILRDNSLSGFEMIAEKIISVREV